jgi:carotenoid 1,2-hydratase
MSDDGQFGLTLIAFVGSVFSPYYAWARKRPSADPDHFCALNVALYNRRSNRWCMTERGRRHSHRDAMQFNIGPSHLQWNGSSLDIEIDEVSVPIPRRVKGRIRLHPKQLFNFSTALDANERHRWGPLAPSARIEVDLSEPRQRWSGHAYLDSNEGDEPIENAFHQWDWSRSRLRDGSTAVIYDMQWPCESDRVLSLRFDPLGHVDTFAPPPRQTMNKTRWRMERRMRSPSAVRVLHQLEDTPFYQRAVLESELLGETVQSFHETLCIPRLVSPIVRAMLPWRMPRKA